MMYARSPFPSQSTGHCARRHKPHTATEKHHSYIHLCPYTTRPMMRRKNERPYLRFKGQRRAQSTNQGTHHCTPMLLTITRTNPPVQLELMNKTYHKCARCGRRLNRANKQAQRLDALYKRQFHMINRAHDTTNQTTVKLRKRQL